MIINTCENLYSIIYIIFYADQLQSDSNKSANDSKID